MRGEIYNPEGYHDPTAYYALKGVKMEQLYEQPGIGYLEGDIVKIDTSGKEVYRIILKVHKGYATTLPLFDKESNQNEYKVKANGVMHTDRGKMMYTPSRDLEQAKLVRSMSEDEFTKFRKAVATTLGVADITVSPGEEEAIKEAETLREEKKTLEDKCAAMEKTVAFLESESKSLMEAVKNSRSDSDAASEVEEYKRKVLRAEAERDVFKDLYMTLLEKMRMAG